MEPKSVPALTLTIVFLSALCVLACGYSDHMKIGKTLISAR